MTLRKAGLCAFGLTSVLAFIGCRPAPKPGEKRGIAVDTAAINALRDQFIAAFNSNDAAATAATYDNDAAVMFANRVHVEGKPAIQASYQALFKENAVKIALTPLETKVTGDWAYDRGNATITVTPKSGMPIEEASEYFVTLRRQLDGSWRIHRDPANRNKPPLPGAAGRKK